MSVLHIAVSAEYRERIIKAAGSQWRVSRWINSVVLPAFFNPSGIEELRQENIRLKGEIEGLRFALSTLRPAGVPPFESADDDRQYHTDQAGSGPGDSDPSRWVHQR